MSIAQPQTLLDEVAEFLGSSPSTEEILAYKPSDKLDQRLHDLLDKNSHNQILPDERAELEEFLLMNHFLKMLRIKALNKNTPL